ncbi:hypothetical protein [Pseudonocardia eucalypti]
MRMVRFSRRDCLVSAIFLGLVGALLVAGAVGGLLHESEAMCDRRPLAPTELCLTQDGTYTRDELIDRADRTAPKVVLALLGFGAVFLGSGAWYAHMAGLWGTLGGMLSGRAKAERERRARMRTTTAIVGAVDGPSGMPIFLILGRYTSDGRFRPVCQVIAPVGDLARHMAALLRTAGADHPWPCSPGFFDALYGGCAIPVDCRRVVPRLVVEVRAEPGHTDDAWGRAEFVSCRPGLSARQVPLGTQLDPDSR